MSSPADRQVTFSAGLVSRATEIDRLVTAWMRRRAAQLQTAGRDATVEASPHDIAEDIVAADHEVEASLRRLTVLGDLVCWRRPRKRWVETGRWVVRAAVRKQQDVKPAPSAGAVVPAFEMIDTNAC